MKTMHKSQVQTVRNIIETNLHKVQNLITEDRGTCIIGEGIDIWVMAPRAKYPKRVNVFTQYWTQGDQPKAIKALIGAVIQEVPEWDGCLSYNCGRMD
jgi:hypothetical protein